MLRFLSSTSSPGLLSCRPFFWRYPILLSLFYWISQTFSKFWSALAGFEEIAVGFESFWFCSVETTVIIILNGQLVFVWTSVLSPIERFHSHGEHLRQLIGEKRVYIRKELTPTGLVWNTNMAAVSFFWNNNMAAVTSCENAILNWLEITFRILDFPLYHLQVNWFSLHFKKSSGKRAERPAKLICPWT